MQDLNRYLYTLVHDSFMNVNTMAGASAAFLDHEVTLRMKVTTSTVDLNEEPGALRTAPQSLPLNFFY